MPSAMPSTMRLPSLIVYFLSCLSFQSGTLVWAEQQVVAGLTITSAPCVWPSIVPHLQRRGSSTDLACSWGSCAGTCLDQGAFCCNPGGTSLIPNWICDNGACITSVRGDTGVVDCYDPDNPSGTTQSCIDFVPTTTCFSTDRCYTCESDVPYCHWQTWVVENSPTLRWFSCISSREADETFLAATITGNPSSTSSASSSHKASASSSTSTNSASPTPTTSIPSSTSLPTTASVSSSVTSTTSAPAKSSSPILSTGAIAGIAVGGAALLILLLAFLIYCFRRRRNAAAEQQEQRNSFRPNISHPSPIVELSTPTYYPNSLTGSGSQVTDEQYWRYHSHPNLVAGEERFKTRMPIELPVPPLPPTTDTNMMERRRGG